MHIQALKLIGYRPKMAEIFVFVLLEKNEPGPKSARRRKEDACRSGTVNLRSEGIRMTTEPGLCGIAGWCPRSLWSGELVFYSIHA